MNEKPILFNGQMVRAILDGRKTTTRRIVKPQFSMLWGQGCPNEKTFALMTGNQAWKDAYACNVDRETPSGHWEWLFCPYGKVGDRLWVRETWADISPAETRGRRCAYKATDLDIVTKWKPSIFLPRYASRITLEITGVRVERLQDISEEDAKAEGCTQDADFSRDYPYSYRDQFQRLWNQINGKDSWDANPFVWVVSFKRVEGK